MQLMVAAMLKNSAILFCDLNTMKGVMAGYLKKIAQPFKIVQFQA